MAKKEKKVTQFDKKVRELNIDFFLVFGLILIVVAAVIGKMFPAFPTLVINLMYIIGVMAFIVYMWQYFYEKRTGTSEETAPEKKSTQKNKGKSKSKRK